MDEYRYTPNLHHGPPPGDEETMTLDELRVLAKERGVPGPDVREHDEGYDGECYCALCLSYM